MDGIDIVANWSTLTALGALLTSAAAVLFARRSAREASRHADAAERAIEHARHAGHGTNVIHFTNRFFDLMRGGMRLEDPVWRYEFWSLSATQFFFFDNDLLPRFMYGLWMIDLVNNYRRDPDIWRSHEEYLSHYAANYPDMRRFFADLELIATREFANEDERILAVTTRVDMWVPQAARARVR